MAGLPHSASARAGLQAVSLRSGGWWAEDQPGSGFVISAAGWLGLAGAFTCQHGDSKTSPRTGIPAEAASHGMA